MKKAVFIALIFVLTLYLGIFAYAEDKHSPLSPGLSVIANDSGMAKSGLCGKDLVFNTDDFLRALNLSEISYITVNSLPSANEGRLLLGTTAVSAGQKISRANLSLLVFVPSTRKETESFFSFSVEDRGYTVKCSIYTLKKENSTPSAAHPSDVSLSVNAYTGGSTFGKLAGYDPDGDTLCFEIVQYPHHGLLILDDREAGTYTYYPKSGFFGGDSFSYVVKDKYGNYSESRTVVLTVASASAKSVYSDMYGRAEQGSAVALSEAGIMFGTSSGIFEPHGYVSREDILVMAMKAAGIGDLPKVTSTVFSDDAEISINAKPYVAAAYQLDYISGEDNGSGSILFKPKENITRAEAALIIDRIIGSGAIVGDTVMRSVFGDMTEIPASAWSALSNLHVLGLIDDTDGSINASAPLTRADAAVMLAGVLKLSK